LRRFHEHSVGGDSRVVVLKLELGPALGLVRSELGGPPSRGRSDGRDISMAFCRRAIPA
jgi:hypothetical protein